MTNDILELIELVPSSTNKGTWAVASLRSAYDPNAGAVIAMATDATSLITVQLNKVAPWVLVAVRKLESLGSLRANWDSYGGRPLRPEAKQATVSAIRMLEGTALPVPSVVLGSDGTVGLEWRGLGKELDIDLGDGSAIEYVVSDRDGSVNEGRADKNDREKLNRLAEWFMSR